MNAGHARSLNDNKKNFMSLFLNFSTMKRTKKKRREKNISVIIQSVIN